VVVIGARRAGTVAVVLAVRGRHRCLPSADDQRSEDGQHGCQTSDGLATWDTTRRPVGQCGERVNLQLGGRPWWCRSRTARASGRRAGGVPRSAVHTTFRTMMSHGAGGSRDRDRQVKLPS
jgi:hypothetical protein